MKLKIDQTDIRLSEIDLRTDDAESKTVCFKMNSIMNNVLPYN